PLLALAIGVAASIYQWEFRHSAELPYTERAHNILQNENYSLLEPDIAAAEARAHERFGPDIALATTGHRTAVHLEFPALNRGDRHIYTLGEPYDETAQFVVARRDWGLDLDSLIRGHGGKGVVIMLNEPDYLLHEDKLMAMYERLCATFDEVEPFRVSSLPPGRVAISFYTARVRKVPLASLPKAPCPFIPQLYLAHPDRADFLKRGDIKDYFGMAADPIGIRKVDIMVDHKVVAAAGPLKDDPNVHAPAFFAYDPNYPRIQFNYSVPAEALTPGEHVLSILATRSDGSQVEGAQTLIYVQP
ncbi:MAG: glycosyltransferase, partial [Asticcacaulis sp.]|nr:glycosyltransferase [Asticcacaulis sp.]